MYGMIIIVIFYQFGFSLSLHLESRESKESRNQNSRVFFACLHSHLRYYNRSIHFSVFYFDSVCRQKDITILKLEKNDDHHHHHYKICLKKYLKQKILFLSIFSIPFRFKFRNKKLNKRNAMNECLIWFGFFWCC